MVPERASHTLRAARGALSSVERVGCARGKRTGVCQRAAQVVLRVGVAPGKLRASQLENALDPFCGHPLQQQLSGDPQIDDAPIGLSKSFRDVPSVYPALINLHGLCRTHTEWRSVGLVARDSVGAPPLSGWQRDDRLQLSDLESGYEFEGLGPVGASV